MKRSKLGRRFKSSGALLSICLILSLAVPASLLAEEKPMTTAAADSSGASPAQTGAAPGATTGAGAGSAEAGAGAATGLSGAAKVGIAVGAGVVVLGIAAAAGGGGGGGSTTPTHP